MIKAWEKLFKKVVVYGKYEYQAYATEDRYEIVRYGSEGEYDTVLLGNFYKCTTKREKLQYVIDDLKGLAEQLQEDYDDSEPS